MFGLGLGQSAASVSADLGGLIGENGEALQIAVTNAYVHPAADRFISGNNSVTGTALPTSVTIDGLRALYLDFRHDSQWFNRDTKYIQTNDGSDLFFLPIERSRRATPGPRRCRGAGPRSSGRPTFLRRRLI